MKHLRRRTLSGLVFTILFVHFTGGCDTLNSDLAGLGDAFSPPTPGEAARWMIDPTNAENRRRGTVIIANSSVGAVPVNVAWYRDRAANERDALVLAVSLSALARYGTPDDASLLTPHLEHPDVQVRWAAARGLQRLHNPEAIGSLLSRLRDDGETTDVRVAVARALGQYPGDRAFQGLLAALNKRELALNRAALTSLTTMTGEDFGLDSNAWRAWYRRPDVGADRAFAKGTEYLYPVYDRDVSWLERMAFWSTPRFESPAQPAGLRPENERRTYDEADTGEES
jgi:hypothetical protein